MAIVKQSKIASIRGAAYPARNITSGQVNAVAMLPDGGNSFYFCGEALSKDSLFPQEGKVPTALSPLAETTLGNPVDLVYNLENGAFITNRACASTTRDPTNCATRGVFPHFSKLAYNRQLDINLRQSSSGKLIKFTDRVGVTHTLFSSLEKNRVDSVNFARWGQTVLTLIQGEDFATTQAVRKRLARSQLTYPLGTRPLMYSQDFTPIYVDAENNRIWGLLNFSEQTVNNTAIYGEEHQTRPAYVTYTTVGESGTLAIGDLSLVTGMPAAEVGCSSYGMEVGLYFFMGTTPAGATYWLLASENDDPTTLWSTREGNWPALGNWYKTANGTRITIVRVNADLSVTVLLGPLGRATGWSANTGISTISDNFGHHMCPSPFTPSPKAGEANVFYSYMPVCSTTDVTRYLVVRWDKNDDSMDVRETTLNGFDPDTYYRHPSGRNTRALMVYPTMEVITAESGNQYLVQYSRHLHANTFPAAASANEGLYNAILVMAIDSTDPRTLSFTQSIQQARLMDLIPLSANGRTLVGINETQLLTYTFDETNFLTVSSTTAGKFFAAGKDASGNLYGVAISSDSLTTPTAGASPYNLGGAEYFIPSQLVYVADSLTTRVSLAFEDATIEYEGANLSKNLVVSAYNEAGSRIVTNLVIKLSTSVATFTANGQTAITVSTSAAADTTVGITITGAGAITASASFTV